MEDIFEPKPTPMSTSSCYTAAYLNKPNYPAPICDAEPASLAPTPPELAPEPAPVPEPVPVPASLVPASLVPASLAPAPPAAPLVPVSLAPAPTAPLALPAPLAPAPTAPTVADLLFNKIIYNASLLSTVQYMPLHAGTIPTLIFSILTAYNGYTFTTPAHKLTEEDIQTLLERVYQYLVEKYNLIDEADRLNMYALFDASLRLCLARPNVKKEISKCKCFSFLR
jgi:hypothetical protein